MDCRSLYLVGVAWLAEKNTVFGRVIGRWSMRISGQDMLRPTEN